MTTEKRRELIQGTPQLVEVANQKLRENDFKPDDWREMTDAELLAMLRAEVDEVQYDLLKVHRGSMAPGEFRDRLMRELRDVVNCCRFIADKYGGLDAT